MQRLLERFLHLPLSSVCFMHLKSPYDYKQGVW